MQQPQQMQGQSGFPQPMVGNLTGDDSEPGTDDILPPPPQYSQLAPSEYDKAFGNPMLGSSLPGAYFSPEQVAAFGPPPAYDGKELPTYTNSYAPIQQEQAQLGYLQMPMASVVSPVFDNYEYKHWDNGVRTLDPRLTSTEAMMGFFLQHNGPPTAGIRVHGYHYETRHSTSGSGKNRRTTTRRVRVTDFLYTMDISRHIIPHGFMQVLGDTSGNTRTFDQVCQEYLNHSNSLKSIKMFKTVQWDFATACDLVRQRVRALGWRRHLSVSPVFDNFKVNITCSSALAQCYTNECVKLLCCLTCLCILWYPVMWCYKKNFDSSLRSHFHVDINVAQWWQLYSHHVTAGYGYWPRLTF
jgi:hypothetical protein